MTSQTLKDRIVLLHRKGFSASELAKTTGLPLDEIRHIIIDDSARRRPPVRPEFIEPPLFE